MRNRITKDIPVLVFGLVFVVGGIDIIIRGKMRNLLLDDEKYLVGGLIFLVGAYALFLVLKK